MSEEMSARVAKSLASTDWEKVSSKWKMNEGERDGFLYRMNRLNTIFQAPDAMSRSYGIRTLISKMAEESDIAAPHIPGNIRHINTDDLETEI